MRIQFAFLISHRSSIRGASRRLVDYRRLLYLCFYTIRKNSDQMVVVHERLPLVVQRKKNVCCKEMRARILPVE